MRVVIDTNVLASALFFGGLPRRLVDLVLDGQITALVSETITTEYEETINELLQKYNYRNFSLSLPLLMTYFECIEPSSVIQVCRDPDDDKFISCAKDGSCSVIVSGDSDLLVLKEYEGIKISTVRMFFDSYT